MAAPPSPSLLPVAPSRRSELFALVALGLALAALAPFLALCAYAHPQNDDYVMALSAIDYGVLRSAAKWLHMWSGRYVASILVAASPLTARSLPGFRWMTLADLLVLPAGAWMLVSALAPRAASRAWRLSIALGFVALHYAGMPSPARGLYWLNGAACYLVGEGLALGAAACVVQAERPAARRAWACALAGALLVVLAAGTNEVIALLLTGGLAILLANAALRRRPISRLVLLLVVAAAAAAVTVLLRGTQMRMRIAAPPGGRHLLLAVAPALAAAGRHALAWIASPLAPAAALLGLGAARAAAEDEGFTLPHPGVAGPLLAAACLATVFLPFYGGGALEEHTLNLVHALFTGSGLFLAACTGAWMGHSLGMAPGASPALRGAAFILLLALGLLPVTPLRIAYDDLVSGRAARHDQALLARYRLIDRCPKVCEVPPLADPPRSLLWFEDAVDEATDPPSTAGYKDHGFAAYFGKTRIRLAGREPAPVLSR